MKAILISQEKTEFPLDEGELYSIGSAKDDRILVIHGEVAPHHVQLSYDSEKNTWHIMHQAERAETRIARYKLIKKLPTMVYFYLQNGDEIILTRSPYADYLAAMKTKSVKHPYQLPGYRLTFKESEEPFPKQKHPPEPIPEPAV